MPPRTGREQLIHDGHAGLDHGPELVPVDQFGNAEPVTTAQGDRFATPGVAAGVLCHDAAERVLLVKPTYKDGWEIPGG